MAQPNHPSPQPTVLEGITVIDFTQALAGPYCTMLLGDLGAEVIKVERPGEGDQSRGWGPPFLAGESAYFLGCNRNKRSLTLNVASEEGQRIMHRLLEQADVFVNNLPRHSSLEKYGLDAATWQQRNPRLIHCSITGFGRSGPYADRSGYDVLAQAMSGTMALTGEPEGEPMRFPTAIADITAGIYALIGILGALLVRKRTGQGQTLDVALLDSQITWLSYVAANYFATGERPPRLGNLHPTIVPYQPFRARDKFFIVGVGTERLWQRFCQVLGIEETVMSDARFASNTERLAHREELVALLQPIFLQEDAEHWLEVLTAADIPCGPINHVDEALSDPQVLARRMIVELEHPLCGLVKSLGCPIVLSATPVSYRRPPPLLGQHTAEILADLGYSAADVARLRTEGVV
ncbi:MAG: CaiB/BaiF CoA-transferase family protein [Anaerolineae bacterium]|nr:CaiB/BaiF CoA-transferase family protein [Anaerolineae bacterium]